jgi:hypothetical protein
LALAGLIAQGQTVMTGVHHWQRGYYALEFKLQQLGAHIELIEDYSISGQVNESSHQNNVMIERMS